MKCLGCLGPSYTALPSLAPSRNCPHQCSQSIGDLAEGLRAQAAQQRERHDLARKALGAAHLDGGDGDEVRDADGDHGPARAAVRAARRTVAGTGSIIASACGRIVSAKARIVSGKRRMERGLRWKSWTGFSYAALQIR